MSVYSPEHSRHPGLFTSSPQSRTLRALLVIVLFTYVAQNMLNVSIAPLARQLHLAEWVVGLAVSTAALFVAMLSQFWGRRSMGWGRRRVLLSALTLALVAGTLFSVAVALRSAGLVAAPLAGAAIVLARGPFFGSAVAAIPPTGQALIAELTTDEASRVRGMAAFSGCVQMSIMIGSLVSSALGAWVIVAPVHATPWFVLIATYVAWRWVPQDKAMDASPETARPLPPRVSWLDPRLRAWIASGVGMFFTVGVVQITMGFVVQDRLAVSPQRAVTLTGLMLLANAAGAMVTQLGVVPRLHCSPHTLLRLGTSLGVVALLGLALAPSLWWMAGATLFLGVASGLTGPGFTAGGSLAVSAAEQGGVAGVLSATGALTWIVAPVTATALYGWQPLAPFALAGLLLSVSAIVSWTALGTRRRRLPRLPR